MKKLFTMKRDELVRLLERMREHNNKYNLYTHVLTEDELEREIERTYKETGKEEFIPLVVKDNISVADLPLTCASGILKNFVATYDATVIRKLRKRGFVVVAKANMDEFAMGSTSEHSVFGRVKNPIDPDKVPGGSSGGSAASVALGDVQVALGSDTGGSVRQPAAFCGVVALKPTYGTVSRFGLVAFASSLDQIAPFGDSVDVTYEVFEAMKGEDEFDATAGAYVGEVKEFDASSARVAVLGDFLEEGVEDAIREKLEEVAEFFKADVIKLEELKYTPAAYYIISPAEASSNLARYDGIRYGERKEGETVHEIIRNTRVEGFGEEVKRRILIGTFVLSYGYEDKFYKKAVAFRRHLVKRFAEIFEKYDVILAPSAVEFPFEPGRYEEDPVKVYKADIATIFVNLAGLHAWSVPVKTDKSRFPVGIQLIGRWNEERFTRDVANVVEENFGYRVGVFND